MNEPCKKENLKLHTLAKCAKFMSTEKIRLTIKSIYNFAILLFSVDVLY